MLPILAHQIPIHFYYPSLWRFRKEKYMRWAWIIFESTRWLRRVDSISSPSRLDEAVDSTRRRNRVESETQLSRLDFPDNSEAGYKKGGIGLLPHHLFYPKLFKYLSIRGHFHYLSYYFALRKHYFHSINSVWNF